MPEAGSPHIWRESLTLGGNELNLGWELNQQIITLHEFESRHDCEGVVGLFTVRLILSRYFDTLQIALLLRHDLFDFFAVSVCDKHRRLETRQKDARVSHWVDLQLELAWSCLFWES